MNAIEGKIRFGLPERTPLKIEVFDLHGSLVKTWIDDVIESGVYEVSVDIEGLTQGQYYMMMTNGRWRTVKAFSVVK